MAKEITKRNSRSVNYETRKQFGEWLRTARKQMSMRQEDLAQRVGVDQGTVSLWESGEIFPGAENLRELSHTFDVPIEAFYGDEVKPEEETSPGYMPRIRVVGEIVLSRHTESIEMVAVDETGSEVHLLGAGLVSSAQRNTGNEIVMLRVRGRGESDYNNGELLLFERTRDHSLLKAGDVVIVNDNGNGLSIRRYSECDGSGLLHSIHTVSSMSERAYSVTRFSPKAMELWGVEIGRILMRTTPRKVRTRRAAELD